MSAATDTVKTNILNAQLRGVAFPLPTGTYVSLHTADPKVGGGAATEVTLAVWPSYARAHAENGGAIGTGWTVPALDGTDMATKNTYTLAFNPNTGASPVAVTHWAVWTAAGIGAGTMLFSDDLAVSRIVAPGEMFAIPANALVFKMP